MKRHEGRIISWIIFVVLILIGFFILWFLQRTPMEPSEPSDKPVVTKPVDVRPDDEGPSRPFATAELTDLQKLEADNQAYGDALKANSLDGCAAIEYDVEKRGQCEDSINYSKVLNSGSEQACRQLNSDDLKQKCLNNVYYTAALEEFDTGLCEKLTNENLKKQCEDKIASLFGKTAQTEADCNAIGTLSLRQECLDKLVYNKSLSDLSLEGCDGIAKESTREQCLLLVQNNIDALEESRRAREVRLSRTSEDILDACGDDECRDRQYFNLALENKDLSLCEEIISANLRDECNTKQAANLNRYYLRLAAVKNDRTLCSRISEPSLATVCLDNVQ